MPTPYASMATNFLNVKRRVIYTTAKGKYVVKTAKGLKYAPKAKYYRNPQGSTVNVKYAHGNVAIPSPIRPKLVRKERKNSGAARGKYAARVKGMRVLPVKRAGFIAEMYEGYAPKRPVGRPRKMVASPAWNLPNPGLRKCARMPVPSAARASLRRKVLLPSYKILFKIFS